jgi:hypothetical protein
MTPTRFLITLILALAPEASSFSADPFPQTRRKVRRSAAAPGCLLFAAAGRGFAGGSSTGGGGERGRNHGSGGGSYEQPSAKSPAKTYGDSSNARPIRDLIDSEAAMTEFFSGREDWMPLFRRVALGECPATDILAGSVAAAGSTPAVAAPAFEFHETSSPWRMFPAIPTGADDRQVLAGFLDSMQQSLLDIPVTDSQHDDDNDIQFVEEGRRLLALSRFHVLRRRRQRQRQQQLGEDDSDAFGSPSSSPTSTPLESYDSLFATAWSELLFLLRGGEEHTGSLILLPDHEMADVRRFADMNLQRPLEWMGLQDLFEVASLHRDSPAIRLLYRLRDIPDTAKTTEQEDGVGDDDAGEMADA